MPTEIVLTKGRVALVDDDDASWARRFRWYAKQTPAGIWYANTGLWIERKTVQKSMHRLLLDEPDGWVDHIDRDGLNNQRANLRVVTPSQNAANSISKGGGSQYKGVSWDADRQRWFAKITVDRKQIALGRYGTEEEAATAYDVAARRYFGEHARLNL